MLNTSYVLLGEQVTQNDCLSNEKIGKASLHKEDAAEPDAYKGGGEFFCLRGGAKYSDCTDRAIWLNFFSWAE